MLVGAMKDLEAMEKRVLGLISPRVADQPKVIQSGGSVMGTQPNTWLMPGVRR